MIDIGRIKKRYKENNSDSVLKIAEICGVSIPADANLNSWLLEYYEDNINLLDLENSVKYEVRSDKDRYYIQTHFPKYFIGKTYSQITNNLLGKIASFRAENGESLVFTEETDFNEGVSIISFYVKANGVDVQSVTDCPVFKAKIDQKRSTKYINCTNGEKRFREEITECFDNSYYYSTSKYIDNESYELITIECAFSLRKHNSKSKISNSILMNSLSQNSYCGLEITKSTEDAIDNSQPCSISSFKLIKNNRELSVCITKDKDTLVEMKLYSSVDDEITINDLNVLCSLVQNNKDDIPFDSDVLLEYFAKLKRFIFSQLFDVKKQDFVSTILNNHTDFNHSCFEIYSNIDKIDEELNGKQQPIELKKQ